MSDRFLILIGKDEPRRAAVRAAVAADKRFAIIFDRTNCLVVAAATARTLRIGESGVTIGAIYENGTGARPTAIVAIDARSTAGFSARALSERYWGGYVAVVCPTPGSVAVLRAPFGELPCLYRETQGVCTIASDVDLLHRFGNLRPVVNWFALTRFLCAPTIRSDETCLLGIKELRGGDCLTATESRIAVTTYWSPWTFAGPDNQILDPDDAAIRLQRLIRTVVTARGAASTRTVLMLSGGLDSSVIAVAAAQRDRTLVGANVFTADASGDERRYARLVCARLGLPLRERCFELDGVDLQRSDAGHLPRPVARAFEYEARRQAHCVAAEVGGDLVMSGGGGDNIFCSLQSVGPLVDCVRGAGSWRESWRVAREIADLCDTSLMTVIGRGWRRSWRADALPRMDTDLRFLSGSAAAAAATIPRHPWLQPPSSVPPGKRAQVALLLGPQYLTEDADPQAARPLVYSLIAQPVVELCLRIPTWLWFDQGCNRAVARRAFERDLPRPVAWRRSKGSPDGFVVELFESNRRLVRDMLLGGNLARHGLLDTEAIARRLDDDRPSRGSDHGRIMRLVDIEAWTRCWPD